MITITSPEVPPANKSVWAQVSPQAASKNSRPKISRISFPIKSQYALIVSAECCKARLESVVNWKRFVTKASQNQAGAFGLSGWRVILKSLIPPNSAQPGFDLRIHPLQRFTTAIPFWVSPWAFGWASQDSGKVGSSLPARSASLFLR